MFGRRGPGSTWWASWKLYESQFGWEHMRTWGWTGLVWMSTSCDPRNVPIPADNLSVMVQGSRPVVLWWSLSSLTRPLGGMAFHSVHLSTPNPCWRQHAPAPDPVVGQPLKEVPDEARALGHLLLFLWLLCSCCSCDSGSPRYLGFVCYVCSMCMDSPPVKPSTVPVPWNLPLVGIWCFWVGLGFSSSWSVWCSFPVFSN